MENRIIPALFDANFVGWSYLLSKDCNFLKLAAKHLTDGQCIVFKKQYNKTSCKNSNNPCKSLDNIISHEHAISMMLSNANLAGLDKVFDISTGKDLFDLMAILYAESHNAKIFSCDKNLLIACNKRKIPHACLKKAAAELSTLSGNNIITSTKYNTDHITSDLKNNPFVNIHNNKHCHLCFDTVCDISILRESLSFSDHSHDPQTALKV